MKIFLETIEDVVGASGNEYYDKQCINARVEVEFKGKRFPAWAMLTERAIYVLGFVGKYQTGAKLWRATISCDLKNPKDISIRFGREEHVHRCRKAELFFNEESFFDL